MTSAVSAQAGDLISAITLGVILSRHLLKTDSLADAAPQQIVGLLRPCLRSLTLADPSPSSS